MPVVLFEYDGHRYLIAAFVTTEWSRNLRAAGIGRLSGRGRVEEFTTTEVPADQRAPDQRAPLIEAYLEQFGTLPTVARTFHALPDPGDHPTFAIASDSPRNEGPTK